MVASSFLKVRRVLRFLCVFGRLHFSYNCALVVADTQHLQFIFLGVDPRIGNVMDCVPREWRIFESHGPYIFDPCGRRPV